MMNLPDATAAQEGFLVTYFLVLIDHSQLRRPSTSPRSGLVTTNGAQKKRFPYTQVALGYLKKYAT